MRVQVTFGALADPLARQLGLPSRRLRYLQECADGIVALSIGGLLTDAETHRARQRLMKRIMQTFRKELSQKGPIT